MTIKLKYSDEPIEVTGMSFDEDGVFKGYFKEGDPAAPVKTDEFYPKEDCDTVNSRVFVPEELSWRDISKIRELLPDYFNELFRTRRGTREKFPSNKQISQEILKRFLEYKHKQLFKDIITRPNK